MSGRRSPAAQVAIVSDKPHTTRNQIRGIHTSDEAQLVLVDLPGWQRPIDLLTQRMQGKVNETMADDVDVVLLVISARDRIGAGDRYVARHVFPIGAPVVIALNKIDRLKPAAILESIAGVSGLLADYVALHPISARTGDGVPELEAELAALLPAAFELKG